MEFQQQQAFQSTQSLQESIIPDEFRDFNHYYNIQLCVMNCINRAGSPIDFISAVNAFEITLLSDLDSELSAKIKALNEEIAAEKGKQAEKLDWQFYIAKEKFRLLYGFMKKRAPVKAVLAIGRPKCHNCHELIKWDREKKEEAVKND